MRKLLAVVLVLGALCGAVPAFAAADIVDIAKLFFGKWTAIEEQKHPKMLDYYADDARILAMRTYGDRSRKQVELNGAKYKRLTKALMATTAALDDTYKYEGVTFGKIDNDTVKISAVRYSLKRCYWDKSYYVIVQRMKGGAFGIIEEYSEGYDESQCAKLKQQQLLQQGHY